MATFRGGEPLKWGTRGIPNERGASPYLLKREPPGYSCGGSKRILKILIYIFIAKFFYFSIYIIFIVN
jgi:hypothetical protein